VRLLYKPLAIVSRRIASKLGQSAFRSLWARIAADEPPLATAGEAGLAEVVGAAVLEAATTAAFTAVADRVSAQAFRRLFGVWPDDRRRREGSPGSGRS
jgi:hypothetical protein